MSQATSRRPHTPREGRVVYDRPRHKFTYSRAIRILARVDWTAETLADAMLCVGELQKIYLSVLANAIQRSGGDPSLLLAVGGFALRLLGEIRNRITDAISWVWDAIKKLMAQL